MILLLFCIPKEGILRYRFTEIKPLIICGIKLYDPEADRTVKIRLVFSIPVKPKRIIFRFSEPFEDLVFRDSL